MTGHDHMDDERFARNVAAPLRAAERLDDDFRDRLLAAVRAEPRPAGAAPAAPADIGWWRRARTVRVSPLGGLALAAGVAGLMAASAALAPRLASTPAAPTHVAVAPPSPDTVYVVRFVLSAPSASSVALVGSFNAWDRAATRLRRAGDGTWVAQVTLPAGRHEYAFIVDGRRWMADPAATQTIADDFGTESSLLTLPGWPSA